MYSVLVLLILNPFDSSTSLQVFNLVLTYVTHTLRNFGGTPWRHNTTRHNTCAGAGVGAGAGYGYLQTDMTEETKEERAMRELGRRLRSDLVTEPNRKTYEE